MMRARHWQDPTNLSALNNMALLLEQTGDNYKLEARTKFHTCFLKFVLKLLHITAEQTKRTNGP